MESKDQSKASEQRLHDLRGQAHNYFDRLWQSKRLTRKEAYLWLRLRMKRRGYLAHIRTFNENDCLKLIQHVKDFEKDTPLTNI